jgi:hypothetical protein
MLYISVNGDMAIMTMCLFPTFRDNSSVFQAKKSTIVAHVGHAIDTEKLQFVLKYVVKMIKSES